MVVQPKRGNLSKVFTWDRTGPTEWKAVGTLAVVRWHRAGQGYTVTHPTTGEVLRVANEAHLRFGEVRVFGRPEDAKSAARKVHEREAAALRARPEPDVALIDTEPYARLRA